MIFLSNIFFFQKAKQPLYSILLLTSLVGGSDQMGGTPKILGKPPKWMVKIRNTPIKMDDLGGFPPIFGGPPRCL